MIDDKLEERNTPVGPASRLMRHMLIVDNRTFGTLIRYCTQKECGEKRIEGQRPVDEIVTATSREEGYCRIRSERVALKNKTHILNYETALEAERLIEEYKRQNKGVKIIVDLESFD